jgi:ribonuclease VapC
MSSYVWDASALLTLINKEPGHDNMQQYLPGAYMSSINISEVASILLSMSMKQPEIEQLIHSLIPNSVPFDNHHAYRAADLRGKTKSMGLSLGDRTCISLGEIKKRPLSLQIKFGKNLILK